MHRGLRLAAALIGVAGAWHAALGLYLPAKAVAAQWLLERAWQQTRAGRDAVRPWPWADTWPVARLHWAGTAPLIVLAGSSGRSLAFAPGHLDGSSAPGAPGHSVISAHRDTHFRGLGALRSGDVLHLETADGRRVDYRVEATEVIDTSRQRLARLTTDEPWLTLVTCYPFDALRPGGPLRYLVHARAASPGRAGSV